VTLVPAEFGTIVSNLAAVRDFNGRHPVYLVSTVFPQERMLRTRRSFFRGPAEDFRGRQADVKLPAINPTQDSEVTGR